MVKISLASARVNAGLTQVEVAKHLNKSKATIVSWEKGKTYPTLEDFERLCNLYNVSKDDIFLKQNST